MHSETRQPRKGLARGAALYLLLVAASCNVDFIPNPNPTDTTYSGRASLALGEINGSNFTVGDTGQLPAAGGFLETGLIDIDFPGVLSAEVLHSTVIAQDDIVNSESSLADLDITIDTHHITLDFLITAASAQCSDGLPSVDGGVEIAGLVVDGVAHVITADPNQSIDIKDGGGNVIGSIVSNEQIEDQDGDTLSLTVNGLHIVINDAADIVLGYAHADITCAEPQSEEHDFVTGGGFITGTPSGEHGNFGVAGGNIDGTLWGHLLYRDHGDDVTVKGTAVTGYTIISPTKRRIEGDAQVNGVGGFTYVVEVEDNGEPGSSDTFSIELSNGYSASGVLQGGNIQLHI